MGERNPVEDFALKEFGVWGMPVMQSFSPVSKLLFILPSKNRK